ncbi:MAG TPA: TonB-dependent receptor [Bryobacteraceae bacterium]|nr:TonB-dependent receptor [Bryobacteraceae bacterium]
MTTALRNKIGLVLTSAIALTLAGALLAQSNRATITGRVIDATNAYLQGAQVQVLPAGVTVVSDAKGEFRVADLAPGDYKLVVNYVGFKTSQTEVHVEAAAVKQVNVQMDVASAAESIVVTADRPHGEAEGIERTRNTDNVVQVLSGEVIRSLPNANVADALGRLPSVTLFRDEGEGAYVLVRGTEPRLTNMMINGVTIPSPEATARQVRLDALPAGLVESVEINKTLAPNIDGDGIGGSVNLKTKTAGDSPVATLSALGGRNSILGGRYNDQLDATLGKRFLADHRLGALIGASYDWNGRGIDEIDPAIDPTSTPSRILYKNDTDREYKYYRTRWGISGSVDYKFNNFTDIYVRGIYSEIKDYGEKWYYSPSATGAAKFYTSQKSPEYSIGSINAGGHHYMNSSWFSWELAAGRSFQTASAGNPKADFAWIGPKLTCGYDPTAQTNPSIPTFGSNCEGANSPLLNANNWGFQDITTSSGLTADLNLTALGSYTKEYSLGGHRATFEVGAKVRNGHKFSEGTETVYDGWTASKFPMNQFESTFTNDNYYEGAYFGGHYAPVSDFNLLKNYTLGNLAGFVDGYKTAQNNYPNQFNLIERITAGYVMNTVDIGKWRVMAGLRLERTLMDTAGYDVTLYPAGSKNCPTSTGCGTPVPVTTSRSYIDPLPSVTLRYALSPDSDIRGVYGRGISRPDPYQLIPYVTEDDSTNPFQYAIGNPDLRPTHANNYDLLYERFLRPIGMIQAGVFYKQLSSPLVSMLYTPATGEFAGVPVTQEVNGTNSHIAGFEVSYQQHFTFLPGPLKALGAMTNYSYTASHVKSLPGRPDSPALQWQVPHTWNISPTYDNKRVSIRVGMTYNGASIFSYAYTAASDPTGAGPTGPAGDVYLHSHFQVDAQGSVRLYRGFTAVAYGLNLNNAVDWYYTGQPIYVKQMSFFRPTIAVGFRYDFLHER